MLDIIWQVRMTNSRKLEAQKDEGYLSEETQVLRSGVFRY